MRRALFLSVLPFTFACDPGAPLERSCGGEIVGLCDPHEYALVESASLEPAALPIADFSRTATFRVELERCPEAPAPHEVLVEALVPTDGGSPDAGPDAVRVVTLLTLEPGRDGDAPGDDVLEADVANPFMATVPPETDVTLRFTARSTTVPGCSGGVLEIPYRTGPRRE
jgi:hypothetical protein